jgi:glycosyltransferase involved in cell wall biosynthesis
MLYLDSHPGNSYLEEFAPGFSRIHRIDYIPRASRFLDAIDALTLAPVHSIRRKDPRLLRLVKDQVEDVVKQEKIDVVHSWVRMAEQFVAHLDVPVLFDLCDALSLQISERIVWSSGPRVRLNYLRFRRMESRIVARYPTTFVAQQDAGYFTNACGASVIPNGVDLDVFRAALPSGTPTSIVFSGSMAFPPNVDAANWFAENVWPSLADRYPDLKWYIVGANPSAKVRRLERLRNVVVTGFVRDIREFLEQCHVVVAPMVTGSGIKNKVLEAMACGRAVVSTPLGAEGVEVVPGRDIEIARTPSEFVSKIRALLDDPERAIALGRAARGLVESRYSWDHVVDQYESLYQSVCAGYAG